MTEYIVCFDIETTGLDKQKDSIIQIALSKFTSKLFEVVENKSWYVLPKGDFEINEGAFEKHGISKEFLQENGVSFESIADEVIEFIGDNDLLTYNGNSFDIPFLYEELKRVNRTINLTDRKCYDAFQIESQLHSKTLIAAYKRYTGKDLNDAHNAFADVNATIEVFHNQLYIDEVYENFETDDVHKIISPDGFIKKNQNGDLVFAIGKYANTATYVACKDEPSYIKWLFTVCAEETKQAIINDYKYHNN